MTIFVLSAQLRPATCRHWRTAEPCPRSGFGSIRRGARLCAGGGSFRPASLPALLCSPLPSGVAERNAVRGRFV